jgi:8-oxo-dGTP pyrophosphatase MutT (NUDIX family)
MSSGQPSERGHAEWLVYGERPIYESRWLRLNLVDVETPDGTRFEHHVVRMQRVAVATVVDDEGECLLMMRRHRFVDRSWGWEVPVGIVEPGEDPLAAAAREVEEETGWQPKSLTRTLAFQPAIGIADTPHEVFFGRGATRVGDPQDDNEADQIAWVPLSQLLDMVDDNRIRDGASLVAVLHLLASRRAT